MKKFNQKEYNKKYYKANKKTIKRRSLEHYKNNKKAIKEYCVAYRIKNKETIKKWHKKYNVAYNIENKEAIKEYHKRYDAQYRINNRKAFNKRHSEYNKLRRQRDVSFKILCYLRNRLHKVLEGVSRSKHTVELLGCSIKELKAYLAKQFKPRMTWKNYGKWHVDHKRPCASFDLSEPKEQRECFNYTNLQPLWAEENNRKGSKYKK